MSPKAERARKTSVRQYCLCAPLPEITVGLGPEQTWNDALLSSTEMNAKGKECLCSKQLKNKPVAPTP